MARIDKEWNAAADAEMAIRNLSPLIPSQNTKATVKLLRTACRLAIGGKVGSDDSRDRPLNIARDEIGFALASLMCELEDGPITRQSIDRAKRAVQDWKYKLAAM